MRRFTVKRNVNTLLCTLKNLYITKYQILGHYDRLDSVTDMLSSLKWRSLELRRSDARLCMLYKQSNGLATYECDKLQKEHKSRMDTRLSSLEQPRCTCDYNKNSFYPRTIAQWNNLPSEIIASTSLYSIGNRCVILHISNF